MYYMLETLKESLRRWSDITEDRHKLQHTYLASSVLLIIIAGVVGLFNYDAGQQLLLIALLAAMIFLINAVVWALASAAIFTRIEEHDSITNKGSIKRKNDKNSNSQKKK
jgi:undecaprenyl pyrophosphate phosphatase UppP